MTLLVQIMAMVLLIGWGATEAVIWTRNRRAEAPRIRAEAAWRRAYVDRMVKRGVDRMYAQDCCDAGDVDLIAWVKEQVVQYRRSATALLEDDPGADAIFALYQSYAAKFDAIAALLEAGQVDRQRWETLAVDAANAGASNWDREYGMRLLGNMAAVERRCPAPPPTEEPSR